MGIIIILLISSNIGLWSCLWKITKELDKSFENINKEVSNTIRNIKNIKK